MKSSAEIAEKFISEHVSIKDCLKKGLINYSALSRYIAKELGIEKSASKEAIAVSAIRLKEKLKGKTVDDSVLHLFKKSNIEIKNNVVTFTIEKGIYPDALVEIESSIKKKHELFFSIEGKKTITLILQKENSDLVEKKLKNYIGGKKTGLSLISITCSGIEDTPGAVAYLAGLFFEKGINIEEFMSCFEDTLIVIDSKELPKIMSALNF